GTVRTARQPWLPPLPDARTVIAAPMSANLFSGATAGATAEGATTAATSLIRSVVMLFLPCQKA
ncbi:MAG: hypothetical protein ACK4NE_05825, partial [Albidovulum sp.]